MKLIGLNEHEKIFRENVKKCGTRVHKSSTVLERNYIYLKYKGSEREKLATPYKWKHLDFNVSEVHSDFVIQTSSLLAFGVVLVLSL